ncbi:response regulator transcription factor [Amycolatopsis minnesotensis]|uniref:response regulator transcription factor n=1 Tax=Amycolatopsis minnesotensis TaxID=337894 RepID=UPI0031D8E7F7
MPVAVHASDAMTRAGLTSMLDGDRQVTVLTDTDDLAAAEVVVVAERSLSEQTFSSLKKARAGLTMPPRCVVITEEFPDNALMAAIECGMTAVLPMKDIKADALAWTIVGVSRGMVYLPPRLQAGLLGQFERVRDDVLKPIGLTMSGLSTRECEVLRMVADGYDTEQIAAKLAYSDSMVKKILRILMSRCGLRNRSHAVAFAMRAGMI